MTHIFRVLVDYPRKRRARFFSFWSLCAVGACVYVNITVLAGHIPPPITYKLNWVCANTGLLCVDTGFLPVDIDLLPVDTGSSRLALGYCDRLITVRPG